MKVSSWYTTPCRETLQQVRDCSLCNLTNFKSHISLYSQKYSKPAVHWERGTALVTCVIIQKIIHEKRRFGSLTKYFSYLDVQSSEHIVILPVDSDP